MRKVVLITGASSGIGYSTALCYAKNGYNVVITYNSNEKSALELEKKLVHDYGVEVLVLKLDISSEDNIKEVVSSTINRFGYIDVLVNNAGIAIDTLYDDKNKINFMKTLEVNTVGTFLMCKYVYPYMLERKVGSIINISSTNGIDTNYVESLDYDASKAAINSLTRNLAKEYAPYIRVNAVCSGWVDTNMNKNLDDDFKNRELDKIFLGRFADPMEISQVIYFLGSDDASYVNSSIIRVDGGY